MLNRILVPLDGSDLADRILTQVRRILVRSDAEVVLLRVVTEDELTRERGPEKEALAFAREGLERVERSLVEQGARATSVVLVGDPATRILEHALLEKVSLIAMTTHGRSGISRAVRGSVAESVLRKSHVPVLLANPGVAEGEEIRFRRILVPLDGSRVSAEILPLAAEVAKLYEAELILAHPASVSLSVATGFGTLSIASRNEQGEAEKVDSPIEGVPVRTALTIGQAATSILEIARREKADLIAMTTHGRSGFSRLAFGSTAEEVVRRCACPLLVRRTLEAASPAPGERAKAQVTKAR